jgi:hypothetical protein
MNPFQPARVPLAVTRDALTHLQEANIRFVSKHHMVLAPSLSIVQMTARYGQPDQMRIGFGCMLPTDM